MRPEGAERADGVEDQQQFAVVQFPRGPDESVAESRLRVLQQQMVRRPGSLERFQPTGQTQQRAEQSFHADQGGAIRGPRRNGIFSRRRKRRR